jgi:C2 domain
MVFDSPGMLGSLIGVFSLDSMHALHDTTLRTIEMLSVILAQSSNQDSSIGNKMLAARSGIAALVNQLKADIIDKNQNSWYVIVLSSDFGRNSATASQFGVNSGLQGSNISGPAGRQLNKRDEIVIKTQYVTEGEGKKAVEREVNRPGSDKYTVLGMNKAGKKNRYYRLRLAKELEQSDYVSSALFGSTPLTRGKQLRTEKSIWQAIFSKNREYTNVGYFKGNLGIYKQRTLDGLMNLGIPTILEDINLPVTNQDGGGLSKIDQDIIKERDVRVRVYLIDASIFGTYDMGSDPDVYTKIYLGDKLMQDNKTSRIDDRANPKFYSLTEFKARLPGPSLLKIVFMDYDPIGSDDYIGATEIDLERRFFDPLWRADSEHPIESRVIKVNSMGGSAGSVRLWVDIDPIDDTIRMMRPAQQILPTEPMNFELRVVVWEAHDVPIDDPEGMSDIYVMGTFDSLGISTMTDTHWRSEGFVGIELILGFIQLEVDLQTED